jgi:excisionase family DNA binding protein
MQHEIPDEILTKPEAAELLKVSESTVSWLVRSNQLPFSRIGKRLVRFSRNRLLEYMAERESISARYNKGQK